MKKVGREALVDWSKTLDEPLPKYEKPKKVPLTAGLYNFIHYNIIQLLP